MKAEYALTILVGVMLGFALSRIGFSDFDEVAAMFALSDLRLVGAFALGVVLLVPAWRLIGARVPGARFSPRAIHPGTLAGGTLFGIGWAVSGACPSIALVQLGEGQLAAILTLVGIFAGNVVYAIVHRRFFKFSVGSCTDD